MADEKPIIIVKKGGGHGGHHGGAWKVAYADFVTAMMAFFMVMWLVNSAEVSTRQNIASYFRQPGLFESGSGTPLMIGEAGILPDAYVPAHDLESKKSTGKGSEKLQKQYGTDSDAADKRVTLRGAPVEEVQLTGKGGEQSTGAPGQEGAEVGAAARIKAYQQQQMEELAETIREAVRGIPQLEQLLGKLEVRVEGDGLVLEVMDTKENSMFARSSAQVLPPAQKAFQEIAALLAKFPNKIDLIGHTDAKKFASRRGGYSNWELSADRANAARRILTSAGIDSERMLSVVGRADRELKLPDQPYEAANRRITLKMRFDMQSPVPADQLSTALENLQQPDAVDSAAPKIETPAAVPDQEAGRIRRNSRPSTITLPEVEPQATNPDYMEKDKIFGDSPVIGPRDPFAGF